MRAICRIIDGVTYDTGTARLVKRVWESAQEGDPQAELSLYRGETGHWFELRREQGQLYGALRPLSAAEAARWLSRNAEGARMPGRRLGAGEAGVSWLAPRRSAVDLPGG